MRGILPCRMEAEEAAGEAAELDPKQAREAAKQAREAAKLAREAAKLAVSCAVCEEPAKSSWLECPCCTARAHLTCLASHFIQVILCCCTRTGAQPSSKPACAKGPFQNPIILDSDSKQAGAGARSVWCRTE